MNSTRLVYGLYEPPGIACDPLAVARLRDLSLSWARFGYQGPVIEAADPARILDETIERGFHYCLLLALGTILDENWYPAHWARRDVHRALDELMDDGDFLAAGRPVDVSQASLPIDDRCLLVNLKRYASSGRPFLAGARPVPKNGVRSGDVPGERVSSSVSHTGTDAVRMTFRTFDSASAEAVVDLLSRSGDASGVVPYLGGHIAKISASEIMTSPGLTAPQRRLLAKVRGQVNGAKRGVFPWNLESYDDVDLPPQGFESPLNTVYCVAAGFKPYRIVQTHGYGCDTRVVLFDYSERALEFRQRLLDEWDGVDYPAFLRRAFGEMPPDTYFQLWADLAPDQVAPSDLDQLWKAETDRWGGEKAFHEHWTLCRALPHEFVVCDLLEDPAPLLERIRSEPAAVIWWSNAFFTIYSNWLLTIAGRRQRYEKFIKGLAEAAPDLYLYGADHMNSSVNSIRADEYALLLSRDKGDGLIPAQFHRLQIRS